MTTRVTRAITAFSMKDKDLLKLLLKDGWELVSIRRSHHKLAKGGKTVSVPVHGKDVKKGLLAALLKETDLEVKK